MSTISKEQIRSILDIQLDENTFLDQVDIFRFNACRKLDAARRSELGQFFTPPPVARLMASMFLKRPKNLHILDAGAGVGSLSAALISEICCWDQKPKSITLAAYEIDPLLVEYLRPTFDDIAMICERNDIDFKGEILKEDFKKVDEKFK